MGKSMFPSDSISFKVSTGGNSAGNGGDGYNKGDITSKPSVEFNPSNKAEGSDVNVKNGDHVSQKASNGDQESDSGHNKSDVDANTQAYQDNWVMAEQGQQVYAGIGGDGGDENYAVGGDVDIKASIESANQNDVLNHSKDFDADLHF